MDKLLQVPLPGQWLHANSPVDSFAPSFLAIPRFCYASGRIVLSTKRLRDSDCLGYVGLHAAARTPAMRLPIRGLTLRGSVRRGEELMRVHSVKYSHERPIEEGPASATLALGRQVLKPQRWE